MSTGSGAEDQLTPLQVGDKLFLCTPKNNVIALDADTGAEIWRRDINANVGGVWERCRGLAYFDAAAPPEQPTAPGATPVPVVASLPEGASCQRRIIMNSIDARLFAMDADTGTPCEGFGNGGQVDLKDGIGDVANIAYYTLTAAPTIAGTTVVIGGRVADNVQVDMPGGVIRGFDVITGAQRWAFDTGSATPNRELQPGETYSRSSANVWAGSTYDPASNTVFLPLGSASVDLYGATRTQEDHRYGASILALDATTGALKWDYQTVRNDLWDFDVPMAPTLIDFPAEGGARVPALVVATKAGQIFVLDRQTGQPLTEVQDVPVKPATIAGEPYAPTQPLSVGMPQIGAETLTEADMWGATPFDQLMCRIGFKSMRYEGLYTAPDTDLSLSFPGSLGGMNWGGVSVDPNNDLLFVNDMRLGLWVQMLPQRADAALSDGGEAPNAGMGQVPLGGTPYAVLKDRFLSPLGIPCQKPPYGTLTAVDLKTRAIAWQVPVGTVQDTGPLGIKMRLPIPVGLPTLGGTLATQGGLVFMAGTQDYYLLLPARLGCRDGRGGLEGPPARRQSGRPDELSLARDRPAICRDLGRRRAAVDGPGRLCHRLCSARDELNHRRPFRGGGLPSGPAHVIFGKTTPHIAAPARRGAGSGAGRGRGAALADPSPGASLAAAAGAGRGLVAMVMGRADAAARLFRLALRDAGGIGRDAARLPQRLWPRAWRYAGGVSGRAGAGGAGRHPGGAGSGGGAAAGAQPEPLSERAGSNAADRADAADDPVAGTGRGRQAGGGGAWRGDADPDQQLYRHARHRPRAG